MVLKKRERITTLGEGTGKIRSEIGKVTEMVADASIMNKWGKR